MKNLKLLLAFGAGVALTLLLTGKRFPNFTLPDTGWLIDGGIGGALGLIALILGAAYLAQLIGTQPEETAGAQKGFLRNLRKSETDCWLGGICGGLGRSTPVPSWVWRLCFAAAFAYYGSGLFAYVLLCIFVPDEQSVTATGPATTRTARQSFFQFLRDLKRSSTEFWAGGVCGGLAEKTAAPAWLWRLGFTAMIFCYGSGFLFYLLLWIFLPSEETKNRVAA